LFINLLLACLAACGQTARKLNEAGVKVTAARYTDMIHDWGLLNPLATVPATRKRNVTGRCRNKESFRIKPIYKISN
jgi:acetyl esterase/lipase